MEYKIDLENNPHEDMDKLVEAYFEQLSEKTGIAVSRLHNGPNGKIYYVLLPSIKEIAAKYKIRSTKRIFDMAYATVVTARYSSGR